MSLDRNAGFATPLDAIEPLLKQVEELRKTAIFEGAGIVGRLQTKAWYEGYEAGISDAVRPATSASRDNPYDFGAGVPAPLEAAPQSLEDQYADAEARRQKFDAPDDGVSNPATGNPAA